MKKLFVLFIASAMIMSCEQGSKNETTTTDSTGKCCTDSLVKDCDSTKVCCKDSSVKITTDSVK